MTVVNPNIRQSRETEMVIPGVKIKKAAATVFTSSNIRAFNNLHNPNGVRPPQKMDLMVRKGKVVHDFKPASVTAISMEID